MKFLVPLLLFCGSLNSGLLHAGNIVKGKIVEENNQKMANISILLLSSKDSSLLRSNLSDEMGLYSFEDLSPGSYLISTASNGFQNYYSKIISFDSDTTVFIHDIQLVKASKQIKELKVTAKKPMIEVKADKTVFNVDQSINAIGINALELLRKSPGVRVDKDDRIEMRGKNNVLIMIDGKPTYLDNKDLAAFLRNMQSADIESIELITNPSSKYDAQGNAGIINIKLKKNKKFGTNGSVNAGVAQGRYGKYNTGINLNNRNKKFNVFGNYGFSGGKNFNDQNFYRQQSGSTYHFKSGNYSDDLNHALKAGVDYYANSNSVFGIMGHLMHTDGTFVSNSKTYIGPNDQPYDQILVASNRIPLYRTNSSINLNYKYEDTTGKSFNADVDYGYFESNGKSYQPNTYWNVGETNIISRSIFRNQTPTKINIYAVKLDHERNLFKGKLGMGVKSAIVNTDNDFRFYDVINNVDVLNLNRTNRFEYTENVNALYANYARTLTQKMSMQAGLRAEHTISEGQLSSAQPQPDDTVKRNYLNLFPSAGLTYKLNAKNNFSLTYSRRIDRPNYQDLNPFENKLDELTYEKGNAFLRPQYSDAIELTHTFMEYFTTALSYSHTKDMFMQTTDTTEVSRTYVTQKNFASQDLMGLNISFPVPLRKWWMIFANVSTNYTMLDANFEGRKLSNNYFTYSFYVDNTITLPNNYSLNISGWYAGPSYWGGTFLTKPMGSLDAGLQKQWLKKRLTTKLSISDIFVSSRWYATSNFSGLYVRGNGNNESRQLRLNISYRFGGNEIAKQRSRESAASKETNRIKGK